MAIMTNPQRALQLWPVLALAAITRTILTYEEISSITGLPGNPANVLGHIYFYCKKRDLPLLSVLAVNKHTGRPTTNLYDGIEVPDEQRRCFAYDWLNCELPTLEEFAETYKAASSAQP
jgi:hypothetical protein